MYVKVDFHVCIPLNYTHTEAIKQGQYLDCGSCRDIQVFKKVTVILLNIIAQRQISGYSKFMHDFSYMASSLLTTAD